MKEKIEKYLRNEIRIRGAAHLSLLDPLNTPLNELSNISAAIEKAGSSGIMVGGSTICDTTFLNLFVSTIKNSTRLPVILFPNNISGLTPAADAIWFMSLLNSRNPYYITGAQMLAASTINEFDLEPLPLAYLIVGEGGAAGIVGDANPLPFDKPEIAASYALAAKFLGMRFIYLEAGSGARKVRIDRLDSIPAFETPVEASIALTGPATEDILVEKTDDKLAYLDGFVDLTPMQAGDTIVVRQYMQIKAAGAYAKYAEESYSDVQAIPLLHITTKPCKDKVKVTAEQTAGTNRTLDVQFYRRLVA